jgi:protein-tyrosine phosphatase
MTDPTKINIAFDPTVQRMYGQTLHGNHYFDVPFISHIKENLYLGGCKNGLVLPYNINHVISLYPWERYDISHEIDTFVQIRMYDSTTDQVNKKQAEALADMVNVCLDLGPTLVHCQAGLNRSSLIASLTLIRSGVPAGDAIDLLREKRSPAVLCNPVFERWLRSY